MADAEKQAERSAKKAALKAAEIPVMEIPEAELKKIGDWVRNRSGLDAYDGACYSRRVEFFKGDELIDCLTSDKFKRKKLVKGLPKQGWTRSQASGVAKQMLDMEFYSRAGCTNLEEKADDELMVLLPHAQNRFLDDEDELYIWTLAQSNTRVIMQSVAFVCIAVFIAAIKAWPIWLKIIVWWCSLIMLICLSSLIVIRIILYALFMVVGLRGIWLLPNLFNEEIDFLDAFQPVFGTGLTMKQSKEMALASAKKRSIKKKVSEKRKKAAKKKDAAPRETVEGEEPQKKAKKEEEVIEDKEPGKYDDCNFGLINLCVILILGMFFCNYFGLFMPDNIPDFVIDKKDLFASYPSLAPPNETLAEDGEAPVVEGEEVVEGATTGDADAEAEESEEYKQHVQTEELEEEEEEVLDEES